MVTFALLTVVVLHGGAGADHLFYLSPDLLASIFEYTKISQPIAVAASVFGKSSIAILLPRLIGPNNF